MPFYASIPSPSLRKMNGQDPNQRVGRFDFGNIVGVPFALASISVAVVAWLISLIGCAIEQTSTPVRAYVWWAIAYGFCCIAAVTLAVCFNVQHRFRLAIVGYLAAGLCQTGLAADNLVNSKDLKAQVSREAGAAGFILFAMVQMIWIGYFGQSASSSMYDNAYAMNKDQKYAQNVGFYGGNRPETSTSSHNTPYTSAQLGGTFETSVIRNDGGKYMSGVTPPASTPTPGPSASPQPQSAVPDTEVSQPTEYPFRAQAMYAYEANPEDANEISFAKGDILDVWDVSGRWWQARKENGETGIAPSNYLILVSQ